MATTVERVASAILRESMHFGALAHHLKGKLSVERRLAAAAVEELRQPPVGALNMLAAHLVVPEQARDVWCAVVDAVLAEEAA